MTIRNDYDTPWKEILDCFFRSFVEFCLPEAAADIDWGRGYEALDKELIALARDHEIGKRIADKLYKVWHKEGGELFLFFHIEVQAQKETEFSERMYVYNYRLFDRYRKPVVSVAILADDDPHWRPSSYERSTYYNQLRFDFTSIKLLDYAKDQALLQQSNNPFAIVIWAYIQALQTRAQNEQRLQSKLAVTRALYEHGFNKTYILQLFRFIDWVMELPAPLALEYKTALEILEEEKKMQYITSIERMGIQKGIEQGMQQGIEQGMQQGERLLLKRQLLRRFGELSAHYQERLDQADADQLLAWSDRLFEATTLAEIFQD